MTTDTKSAELTVRDVMQREVVTVTPEATVEELIALLRDEEISGAPVVDRDGSVVGVVSETDVLRLVLGEARLEDVRSELEAAEAGGAGADQEKGSYFRVPEALFVRHPGALDLGLPETRVAGTAVREIMTPATFSVRPGATLGEAARFLAEAKIHRALVFEERRLAGLLTTFDVLRGLSRS